jgi:mycothiol S-conjugate amidase
MARTLMQVHAHPDDEASKGAATTAFYTAQGVRCVLVTCTGGEEGDILNPAADTEEARTDLRAVRARELERSCAILGYDRYHLLGYRDSGMKDAPSNAHPDCFAQADLDEAVGRLVRIIRAEKPDVIMTYGPDHSRYPHPDHVRAHEITALAYDAAADPARYPDAGAPHEIAKLYWMVYARRRTVAHHEHILASGGESPYTKWLERWDPTTDDEITTQIEVGAFYPARSDALRAHATQVAPDSFWFSVDDDTQLKLYPWEDFVLAHSRVAVPEGIETDLFAGVR